MSFRTCSAALVLASFAWLTAVPANASPTKTTAPRSAEAKAARPPARRIVGILDVRVEGVPPEIAAQFQTGLEAQINPQHYWLAPRSRMHDQMANSTKWTEGCLVGMCLNEVKIQTGAELVLLAALTGAGTSFGYVVTLVRTDSGRILAQESERCEVCTVNEAVTSATLAAVKLLNAVPDKLPDDGALPAAKAAPAKPGVDATIQRRHKRLGIALTLAGLALAGGGFAGYMAADHSNFGLATAAAGAGLAAGGVVTLTF